MTKIFPNAPLELVYTVLAGSLLLLAASAYYWTWANPKPKQEVIDALFDAAVKGDGLLKEKLKDTADLIFYQINVKAWIDNIEALLKKETNDEDVYMFGTILPMISKDEDEITCRAAVANRLDKLRRVSARYIRGENIR